MGNIDGLNRKKAAMRGYEVKLMKIPNKKKLIF